MNDEFATPEEETPAEETPATEETPAEETPAEGETPAFQLQRFTNKHSCIPGVFVFLFR